MFLRMMTMNQRDRVKITTKMNISHHTLLPNSKMKSPMVKTSHLTPQNTSHPIFHKKTKNPKHQKTCKFPKEKNFNMRITKLQLYWKTTLNAQILLKLLIIWSMSTKMTAKMKKLTKNYPKSQKRWKVRMKIVSEISNFNQVFIDENTENEEIPKTEFGFMSQEQPTSDSIP